MQSVPTPSYHAHVEAWCRAHAHEPDTAAQLEQYAETAAALLALDLEPARPLLNRCYADSPRGGRPWDPVVLLRALLLALLVGIPSINKLVPALRGSRVLRILAGLPDQPEGRDNTAPGVGTFYGFLHRLHDGPLPASLRGYVRPSVVERRSAAVPRPPGNEKAWKKKSYAKRGGRPTEPAEAAKPATRTLARLRGNREHQNADDLLGRLSQLLWAVAVLPSAERGLLGDVANLNVTGDGSPLVTGASGLGHRDCDCNPRKPCDCPRTYADPDARSGWDAYRKRYFYGHHFYELSVPTMRHDLPIGLRLDPGNSSDHTACLLALEALEKDLRVRAGDWKIAHFIADSGHDGRATYDWCADYDIRPVIPINGAPACPPSRPELKLSERAIPLCEASVEMAPWGSGGPGRPAWCCPVKAGKRDVCPKAPEDDPAWLCQADTRVGPVVSVRTEDEPRLFPAVQRNSATFADLYKTRTGTERSNAVKKGRFRLEAARHRRHSFWLIRLHLIAILQHVMAWNADTDPRAVVRRLLREPALAA